MKIRKREFVSRQYQVGAGRRAGGGAVCPTSGEFLHRSTAGDEVDAGYPHPEWSRV